jgi:hypothetical protein
VLPGSDSLSVPVLAVYPMSMQLVQLFLLSWDRGFSSRGHCLLPPYGSDGMRNQ